MITKAFAIYDGKALAYGVPFFMPQTGQAVRAFSDLVADKNTMINRHPEDYSLYQVGTFNDQDGKFETLLPPTLLGHGNEYKKESGAIEVVDRLKEYIPEKKDGNAK